MTRLWQLILLLIVAAEARRGAGGGGGSRWKPIQPLDGQQECGSEFHDSQSKWLQSELVLQANWRPADEHRVDDRGAFNITVTVTAMLKPWRSDLTRKRITIGQFNRSLGRRQRSLQRQLCASRNLPRHGSRGYIFFLLPTADKNYFRHRFLPIKNTRSNRGKVDRIQCRPEHQCQKAPVLTQEVQLKGGGQRRLVCAARGQPLPRVHWLRDGAELQQSQACIAQYRSRSGVVTTRLILKNSSASAGNYTCVFRNLFGFAVSSLVLSDLPVKPKKAVNLCDNSSKCLNGGTCTIDSHTKNPVCICPRYFTGTLCEKIDFQEYSAFEQQQGAAPISSTALGVVFIAVFAVLAVVLLSVCLLLYRVRRRLDRRHHRPRMNSRSDNAETQFPSNGAATLLDAETMTEAPTEPPVSRQNRLQQQQPPAHRFQESVEVNGSGQPQLQRPSHSIAGNQRPPQHHRPPPISLDHRGVSTRPVFDYSVGLQQRGSEDPDLGTELSVLMQLERSQQPHQLLAMRPIEEAEDVALLPFPGHGLPTSRHPSAS